MRNRDIRTRFAPSPTGELHLGNARTALFNALLARQRDGQFLLRVEDTDAGRSHDTYIDALQDDLLWLGLRWEGSRDAGVGILRQSERSGIYADHYHRLEIAGCVYPCFCSPENLKVARELQRAKGLPPRYPGTCANLSATEIKARLADGQRPALRFRVPDDESIEFEDLVRGTQCFNGSDIGDFIIQRADGTAAFLFSNAIDDALMEISHVLRGEDHLANTPRQLMVLEALGLTAPHYGHLSLITGPDARPLSKRHGDHSLRELRETGYLPAAVLNYLARLGHVYDEDKLFSLDVLAEKFDVNRLGKSPAQHDESRLGFWQQEAVASLSDAEIWSWLQGHVPVTGTTINELVPEDSALALVATIRENIAMPADAGYWANVFFGNNLPLDTEAAEVIRAAGPDFFEKSLVCAEAPPADFKAFVKAIGKATGTKGKGLYMPLRTALTGYEVQHSEARWLHGPELGRIWSLLGSDESCRRLRKAQEYSNQ